jgi:hypothetical protein
MMAQNTAFRFGPRLCAGDIRRVCERERYDGYHHQSSVLVEG